MLAFDLQTLLFILILFVIAAVEIGFYLAQRRQRGRMRLSDGASLLDALNDAPFGVAALEGETVGYVNAYARRLLHLPGDVGTLPDADWLPLLETDRDAARQEIATGAGRYRTITFASGQTVRWWVIPWNGRDFVFLLDITAQQRTEQAGRALINDLGHELRTPIATLLTHLEILGLGDVGKEVQQQSLALAKDEAQRMARLLNDMLELGRLETSQELPRRPVDLVALVEDVVLQSTPRAVERQMALSLEAESPLPFVSANADRLRQVFLNLLDNAFKYARPGDRITISLRRAPNGIACAVCDTGPGIPPEHLPYVTRRFYRAAPKGIEGSGLGLSIVAEILRRHDSELIIESPGVDDVGTCARFVMLTIEGVAKTG
ncbi:MAG TPA: ATP-binding protein [Anaerolineae bacterium]|nr:ATP-binding protein [Anaerolineae bacterium]HQK14249.1 ATP-binding protein [Anaerolineae bacterium]